MDALDLVAGWPVEHAAVGVAAFSATSDAGALRPRLVGTTGPRELVLAWASVTKTATALAVLIAVEEGTLHLDEAAGPPGSTVRHLLAHASGLGSDPGPPLARPGTVRIYSNAGYRALGELLAERSGMSFAAYLGEAVLVPLGMAGTVVDPGDELGAPSAGLHGPLDDLLRLTMEWAAPTLVGAATHRQARTVQFPGLAGVLPGFGRFDPCDWGLGVEIRGAKVPHWTGTANSPATYGHFGRSGSFLWVDPEAGLCCAGLADRAFGPWATRHWPALADEVLGQMARYRPAGHV
jgi:CubicO group peptidase (beta-lactamase class C family)